MNITGPWKYHMFPEKYEERVGNPACKEMVIESRRFRQRAQYQCIWELEVRRILMKKNFYRFTYLGLRNELCYVSVRVRMSDDDDHNDNDEVI